MFDDAKSLSGSSVGQSIYVPCFSLGHRPLGSVSQKAVESLIEKGVLSMCDGKSIYDFKGRALGFVCSDPSLQEHKIRILNREGPVSIWSKPACGLRFDPEGLFAKDVDQEISEILAFQEKVGDPHFKLRGAVFGAHAPCGAAGGMTLEDICRSVAAGARHFGKMTKIKAIPTIFINTEVTISPNLSAHLLLWMHISKKKIL